jgi:hypothetical protein
MHRVFSPSSVNAGSDSRDRSKTHLWRWEQHIANPAPNPNDIEPHTKWLLMFALAARRQ